MKVKEKGHCMSEFEQQGRTDHLESVLQTISDAQQTGILHIERGKGGVREGGDIIILQGQVIEASVGNRQGAQALEWVLTWGNCQYNFQGRFPSELFTSAPNISLPVTPLPPTSGQLPITGPFTVPEQNFPQPFRAAPERDYGTVSASGLPIFANRQAPGIQESGPLSEVSRFRIDQPNPQQPVPVPVLRVPARIQNGAEALALLDRFRFSRLHRHVFLLLDGKRTPHDLVRLTGRPLDEVERLLLDLERTGLITQERH
jgi:Domain of unknown function (DUF4388)